ncbi:transporter [Rhizoctonia solani]|uniref:Transporter n=1 Tax=Rhizoctonia solani TaxID=456999 RepID=A0A8H7HBC5_9AGAM|nr:transporter [Rhizoctonia solani]
MTESVTKHGDAIELHAMHSQRSSPNSSASSSSSALNYGATAYTPLIPRSVMDPKIEDELQASKGEIVGASYTSPARPASVDEFGNPLTTYDRKSLLVNHELDRMGMGRYQWFIVGLCAMGYMLADLLWAQAFGLIAPPLQRELGFSDIEMGNIFTSFSAGHCAGAFMWGVLVDVIGRRWAFNLTVLITSVFGLAIGGPSNYNAIIVLTAFIGLGIGGNIPIDTTITLEFLPQNKRYLLPALSVGQPIGVVLCSALAYGFIPNYSCPSDLKSCKFTAPGEACCSRSQNQGWRYLCFCLGAISLFVFLLRFIVFNFQESPRFLLSKGRDEEAIEVLRKVAKTNRTTCTLKIEDLRAEDEYAGGDTESQGVNALKLHAQVYNFSELKVFLKRGRNLRLVILTWLTYAFDAWGFTIAGSFLPTILLRKNEAIDVSLRDTYKSYVVILFATVNTQAANVGLNAMEYFFQSLFNAILYGWTPEAFPAPIRGSACGIASFWGRLFSIIAPLIGSRLLDAGGDEGINNVLYLAGAGVFVHSIPQRYGQSNLSDPTPRGANSL